MRTEVRKQRGPAGQPWKKSDCSGLREAIRGKKSGRMSTSIMIPARPIVDLPCYLESRSVSPGCMLLRLDFPWPTGTLWASHHSLYTILVSAYRYAILCTLVDSGVRSGLRYYTCMSVLVSVCRVRISVLMLECPSVLVANVPRRTDTDSETPRCL